MIEITKTPKSKNIKCINDRQIHYIFYYQILNERSQFVAVKVNNNVVKKSKRMDTKK